MGNGSPRTAVTTSRDSAEPHHRLRCILVGCQAASILTTWSLWQIRDESHAWPNLPLIQAVPQFGMGWILLFSLVLILARPVWGLAAHAAALAVSIVQDEARLQPEFLSLALLLVGTLPGRWSREVARAHLGSLWLWAGLHKIVNEGYWNWQGPMFVTVYWPEAPDVIATLGCAVIAFSELYLGIAAFVPKAQRFVPIAATLVHTSALVWLAAQSWNYAVWPWQIGLVAAAWGFFPSSVAKHVPTSLGGEDRFDRGARCGIVVAMLAYPALYYVNLLPPAAAWCVYSGNVPRAMLFPPVTVGEDGLPQIPVGTWIDHAGFDSLNVPYPTMPSSCYRLLRQHGKEGTFITISDPRPLSRWRGQGRLVLTKIAAGVEIETEQPPTETTPAEPE